MRGMEQEGPWKELSVCATSSHDMETLRMQFKHDPSVEECRDALLEFLKSPSMLAIFPLQDWLSVDNGLRRKNRDEERINQPADPNHHWRFRIHFDLRQLAREDAFTYAVRDLVKAGGR